SHDEKFSFGFNFRYASHWNIENSSYRILKKAFGLRLIVTVSGNAGRFDFLVLTLHIGSMIGILGLSTFVCDIVALYFSKQGYIYRRQKFQLVQSEHASNKSTAILQLLSDKQIQVKQMNNHQTI
ncbi:unnamed protein product, partial [Rotaria sp. Silwood1]